MNVPRRRSDFVVHIVLSLLSRPYAAVILNATRRPSRARPRPCLDRGTGLVFEPIELEPDESGGDLELIEEVEQPLLVGEVVASSTPDGLPDPLSVIAEL